MERREVRISLPAPKKDTTYTFEEIYKEYHKPVLRAFEILLKNDWPWAEDLTHETFLRILEFQQNSAVSIDTKSMGALLSYLAKCSYVKYKRDFGEGDLRKYDDDPFVLFDHILESDAPEFLNPEKILSQDKRIHQMLSKIDKLKKVDKEILTLLFYNNYSMREAAEALDLSYSNIRKRLQRIRTNLGSFQEVDNARSL